MTYASPDIERLVRDFVERIVVAVQAQSEDRVLAAVGAAFGEASQAGREHRLASSAAKVAVRKVNLTPAGLAMRKLQGKYLGVLRTLTSGKREQVKKVAREKGVAEAIKFAGSLT
jgi:hypothetical protein